MCDEKKYRYESSGWISNYLLGISSEEEKEQLNEWLAKSERNQRLLDTMCQEVIDRERMSLYSSDVPEKAFLTFLRHRQRMERRHRLMRRFRYAAVFILPLCIGGYLWWSTQLTRIPDEVVHVTEQFSSHLPVITLSTGEEVVLKNAPLTLSDFSGHRVAEQDSDVLIYSARQASPEVLEYHTLRTPVQCDYRYVLSDGTKVWVNAKTTVKYPIVFAKNERVIQVDGEVYLEVAKDPSRPFYVETRDLRVKVLGTSFNVNAYDDEAYTAVTLVEGKVTAGTGERVYTLFPAHQLHFDRQTQKVTIAGVEVEDFVAWRNGAYVFKGQTLEEVCRVLQRWYDVEIIFENQNYLQKIYTGIVYKEESIENFIRNLNASSACHSLFRDNKLYIR